MLPLVWEGIFRALLAGPLIGDSGGNDSPKASSYKDPADMHQGPAMQPPHGAAIGAAASARQRWLPTAFGVESLYQPLIMLGKGSSGQAWLCRYVKNRHLYVLKMMERPLPTRLAGMLQNEIMVQGVSAAGHVGVCQLREVLLTPTHAALVLEYAAGGTLYDYVESRAALSMRRQEPCVPEEVARFMFKQLMSAVAFLHARHIVHRDIKLENTLLYHASNTSSPPRLLLCDFQFAVAWGQESHAHADLHLGTPAYMAPELIQSLQCGYDFDPVPVDVWACGIWLATQLLGQFPYQCDPSKSPHKMAGQVLEQQMLKRSWRDMPGLELVLSKLTPDCLDLLDKLLQRQPWKRVTAAQALEHPWMTRRLASRLQAAWEGLQAEQAALQARLEKLQVDEALVKDRAARLARLVEEAAGEESSSTRTASPRVMHLFLQAEAVASNGDEGCVDMHRCFL